ncbi:hypothetical protein BEL04_05165 [Mucilaginibacter sp. PPCGB 2223]|nr:hypothetical protein BEL04_05165 [Mucilaginibacter sp. PPCGB 2223]
MLFASCSVPKKAAVDNDQVLNSYTKPFKIFSVGYWPGGYMVLTLIDVHNQYFTIKTLADTSLKAGLVYNH